MPIRATNADGERSQDSTTFRLAAQTMREMIELDDHPGITLDMAFALCQMLDAAATNVSGVEPELRLSLLRMATAIQDRRTWAPRARAHEDLSPGISTLDRPGTRSGTGAAGLGLGPEAGWSS
jgi:hypothetical protein